jgi:outer membrane lipopolysaccharide assembly protein LptE/RlpB
MRKILWLLVAVGALSACTYSLFINTYPHLKTVRIEPFENRSTQYGIEQDVDETLSAKFQSGNLLKVEQNDPDCTLSGKIVDYSNKIYSYNANNQVREYEVKILFSVTVTDLVKSKVIYQNDQLLMRQAYLNPNVATDDTTEPLNEEDARAKIYEDLYDTIVKNTFQAW